MIECNTVATFKGFYTTWLGVMWSQVRILSSRQNKNTKALPPSYFYFPSAPALTLALNMVVCSRFCLFLHEDSVFRFESNIVSVENYPTVPVNKRAEKHSESQVASLSNFEKSQAKFTRTPEQSLLVLFVNSPRAIRKFTDGISMYT